MTHNLTWFAIFRLAIVQACLGGIVVLTTSTLNRIMVVELALPALIPGGLVAWHYAVQFLRPRMGFAADQGHRITYWIIGGMAILALGGFLAALATVWMMMAHSSGMILACVAFSLIGIGVSCSGTSLLVLLAKHVDDERRAPAATVVWVTMIAGFVITAAVSGRLLDPYSPERLLQISAGVSVIAFLIACVAISGVEPRAGNNSVIAVQATISDKTKRSFIAQLKLVWAEPAARQFTIFIFLSMLAYNAQDLILEPFAGIVFQLTPGQTTSLSGLQHAGVLSGMIVVALVCSHFGRRFLGAKLTRLSVWTVWGCVASAIAMFGLVLASQSGGAWPLRANVFLLGVANGAFSIAAISSMMKLARDGQTGREGTRMGLWGAAQAIAFGMGGALGAGLSDLARVLFQSSASAYGMVFAVEVVLFIWSAMIAARIGGSVANELPDTKFNPQSNHDSATHLGLTTNTVKI